MPNIAQPPIAPWSRVLILIVSLLVACVLSYRLTGAILPTSAGEALIFQNALLLIVLGSALLEHKFTKPAESVVNALMGIITLLTVYAIAPRTLWWAVMTYCAVTLALAAVCTAISSGPALSGWRRTIARATYDPAVLLGKARVLYSVVFLFGVFSFYGVQSAQTASLVVFWGLFLAVWPLGLPELLSGLRHERTDPIAIGRVIRTDYPGLVRVGLNPETKWDASLPKLYEQADGRQLLIVPLYAQVQEEQLLGTGICVPFQGKRVSDLSPSAVYDLPLANPVPPAEISKRLGGDEGSTLLGFVVEESSIDRIRFETWQPELCREGLLVWCAVSNSRVFYQVTDGVTREETLEADRHGFQIVLAAQLGVLDPEAGFAKHAWLPAMNTPVFFEPKEFGADAGTVHDGDFVYGKIPGTEIRIGGPFTRFMDHHTAILGVTGSGKTELAFDVIRHCLKKNMKVVCIDLTTKYSERLSDVPHVNLSISPQLSSDLADKLFEAETGPYGGGKEKQALRAFSAQLREDIKQSLTAFLTSEDEAQRLGIITLEEISNTKATLYITELYLTCLLHFARDNPATSPRTLIVVEEAHTVMPEPTTMGLGDYDSRGLVGKISQIALQGRKYHVGLLVIAQRTATVSKSVLTQCNTVITLNCFDETSLGFLENVYGATYTRLIPNLPRLCALVFGKGVRSERPVMVEIPFSQEKAELEG